MMTVRDMIAALGDYDPDAEVRIEIQPRWPLEYTIGDVVCSDSITEDEDEEEDEDDDKPVVVYITEGSQIGYAPGGRVRPLTPLRRSRTYDDTAARTRLDPTAGP
jgi:hypothetical protein